MINDKYKLSDVAKDLGVDQKEIIDLLEKNFSGEKKRTTALTGEELNFIFETYTQKTELKSLESYYLYKEQSGSAPAEAAKETKAAKAPKEPKAPKQPKQEKTAEKNPQETKAEQPKPEEKPAAAVQEPPKVVQEKPLAEPKQPEVKEQTPPVEADNEREKQDMNDTPKHNQGAGQAPRNNTDRPKRERPQGDRPQGDRPQGDRKFGDKPRFNDRNGDRPQGDRSQGDRKFGDKPRFNDRNGDRPQGDRKYGDKPRFNDRNGDRPNDRKFGDKPQGDRPQNDRPKQAKPAKPAPAPAPRQASAINPELDENVNGKMIRHVDMRAANVDLDKYNERYENIAPENLAKRDDGVKKQKIGGRNNKKKNFMSKKDKEMEKMRKLEMERERRQKLHITLPDEITVGDLALKLKIQSAEIIKRLMMLGEMKSVSDVIDYDTAALVAMEIGAKVEKEVVVTIEERLFDDSEDDDDKKVERPPVVVVMGHVDHGKTSILDAIRHSDVTSTEAGGITQHIGAYTVSINKQKITFLDTPGHEAFTAMRMRGANATDIAILVVAADDGVMPQTVEAINHAKAAGVEIIVAINKIDKPGANVERVKQELSEYELIPEDWGGSTVFVPVSAKNNEGIDDLLEMILLTSEVLELKANPNRKARGLVIEAELDKGKGPVATILVQKGTLHVGDYIAAGACSGKVRAMMDDKGRRVKEAGPSTPVEILGLSDVPNAGEILVQTDNDKEAKNFAATFVAENKKNLLEETKAKMSLDDLFNQIQEGNLKELALVVKADVQGSVEAVKQSLVKLSNEEVAVRVIHGGVGAINESDVMLATASSAIIIGFNVRPDTNAKSMAEQNGVDIRLYRVIYQAIEDVEAAMKGMLEPVYEEKVIGHAEVRQLFKASGVGTIAGSYVLDGTFQRGCKVRISREGNQIFEGNLASLKRFKDDVKEVRSGYECGLVFEGFNDLQEFDQVEAYIMVEVPR